MSVFHLGLIINPLAGLGGPAALKGSDGVAAEALARGAEPRAAERTGIALECLRPVAERLQFITFPGPMGADLLAELGYAHRVLGSLGQSPTTAEDTQAAVRALQDAGCALILVAGGDGTARDVCSAVREEQPVLGIVDPGGLPDVGQIPAHKGHEVVVVDPPDLADLIQGGGIAQVASQRIAGVRR